MRYSARVLCGFLLVPGLSVLAPACSSAYYGVMEKFGYEKRDILVDRVEEGRDAQKDAKQEFQSALKAFQSVTHFDGGNLERVYNKLDGEYKDCAASVDKVKARIESIEKVSQDLFKEWKSEIGQMHSADLRAKSEALRKDTQRQYDDLITVMQRAESKMEPVLDDFHDRVLFLKHNLNASAISSLQGDLSSIERNVGDLIHEMEASIAEADAFLENMKKGG